MLEWHVQVSLKFINNGSSHWRKCNFLLLNFNLCVVPLPTTTCLAYVTVSDLKHFFDYSSSNDSPCVISYSLIGVSRPQLHPS